LLSEGRCSSLKIHEDPFKGEIIVKGAFNAVVTSPEGIMQVLRRGSVNRTTAATNMNLTSSRSHAIFTVFVKQHRMITVEVGSPKEGRAARVGSGVSHSIQVSPEEAALLDGDNHEVEVLFAKFHFVDLAGSERLKRTGATGDRAKEGISINCGLVGACDDLVQSD
jgi:kinesin family protein 4/21/27